MRGIRAVGIVLFVLGALMPSSRLHRKILSSYPEPIKALPPVGNPKSSSTDGISILQSFAIS